MKDLSPLERGELHQFLAAQANSHFRDAQQFLRDAGFALPAEGDRASSWCLTKALSGDVNAQYVSAVLLSFGYLCEADKETALNWCSRAAEHGHGAALLLLAEYYDSGWADVPIDEKRAIALCEKSASAGYAPALVALATIRLVRQRDRADGLLLLRRATALGYVFAEAMLASELLRESSSSQEEREGIAFMHSAAEKGSAHAHSMLSYFYRGGAHGLPVDTRKSDFHNAAAEAIKKKDIGAV